MAGIYIHIPFCHRRCHYCDFYTQVNFSLLSGFYDAILHEIELRKDFFPRGTTIDSIYFGGGTPSILHPSAIGNIIEKLSNNFLLSEDCEVTLEVNPEDVSLAYYHAIRLSGINRLSIGIQSFDDIILQYLNRRHGAVHSVQSIEWADKAGISNINIDLIYGIPSMREELWFTTLRKASTFPVKHISAYHLTIEPRTTFGYLKEKGRLTEISEEQSWQQMQILHQTLENTGFEHYEISNFAKPNFRSRHNQSYWQHKEYLGLGPSAHSFDGQQRYENVRDIRQYVAAMKEGNPSMVIDKLTFTDQMNEEIMLKLRCIEGLSKCHFIERFGKENYFEVEKRARKFFPDYLDITADGIRLNLKGWFISDNIVAHLFFS